MWTPITVGRSGREWRKKSRQSGNRGAGTSTPTVGRAAATRSSRMLEPATNFSSALVSRSGTQRDTGLSAGPFTFRPRSADGGPKRSAGLRRSLSDFLIRPCPRSREKHRGGNGMVRSRLRCGIRPARRAWDSARLLRQTPRPLTTPEDGASRESRPRSDQAPSVPVRSRLRLRRGRPPGYLCA